MKKKNKKHGFIPQHWKGIEILVGVLIGIIILFYWHNKTPDVFLSGLKTLRFNIFGKQHHWIFGLLLATGSLYVGHNKIKLNSRIIRQTAWCFGFGIAMLFLDVEN